MKSNNIIKIKLALGAILFTGVAIPSLQAASLSEGKNGKTTGTISMQTLKPVISVPQKVSEAFAARFPGGKLEKWENRKEGFIAKFRQDGKTWFAYYSADGTWQGTETPVKWTRNLPDSVKAGWKISGYYAWYVEDIRKIDMPGQPLYVLHVNNGPLLDADHHDAYKEGWLLYFSPGGQLIRKERVD